MRRALEIGALIVLAFAVVFLALRPEFDLPASIANDIRALCQPYVAMGTTCTPSILAEQPRTGRGGGTTFVIILAIRKGDFGAQPIVQLNYDSRGNLIATE